MTAHAPGGPRPLVLTVSRHESSLRWLATLLEAAGYSVIPEHVGGRAVERARAVQPDLVLVHANLADVPAVELCRALRADPPTPDAMAILYCTDAAIPADERLAALRAGVWECVTPPHAADEILARIAHYVRAKHETDRLRAAGLTDAPTGIYNRQGLARRARELGAHAFRNHGALGCIALAVDLPIGDPAGGTPPAVDTCIQSLRATARVSDVIGRLGPTELALIAPDADEAGVRRLARRVLDHARRSLAPGGTTTLPAVRCGYAAVGNLGYAPMEPVELLVRASAAVRIGIPDPDDSLRRFDDRATPASVS